MTINQLLTDVITQMVREIAQDGYRHGASAIFSDRGVQLQCRVLLEDVLSSASAESEYNTTRNAVDEYLNTHPSALQTFMNVSHRELRKALEGAHRTHKTSPLT